MSETPDRKSILVVDDDPIIHEVLAGTLRSRDWLVDSAFDGVEGWKQLEVNGYDLVLTDVRTPGLDGLELLRRIRQFHPDTKVLVMTAESTPAHVITAIREHAFSYFSKPFSATAVADMISHALSTPAWQDDIEVVSARPEWISLQVRCKIEVADRLLQFFREMKMDLPAAQREDIAAAFRELLLNAIEHGGKSDPSKKLGVAYLRTTRAIIYYIQDPGEGFSMDSIPHAAISNKPDALFEHIERRQEQGIRPGGFGILLARNLVDELIYNEKGNEVLLIKYVK